MKIHALRLQPQQDLKQSLKQFVEVHGIQAGFIVSAVGSLEQASLRFANRDRPQVFSGKFEIVSLVGTLAIAGMHLHLAIADREGRTLGGHLVEGCLIYTTAEIVIGESETLTFSRIPDPQTGYLELHITEH